MKLSFYTKFLPTIALLLLLFNGCSTDDVIGSTNNDMDHLPNLYGHIVDANTNTSLDSVMIIGSGSTTTYTDSNGFYMFENLNYGDYTFVVSDSGYATIISSFNLQIPLVNDDEGMLADNANDLVLDALHHEHNMSLVTLSAGLSGTVYKTVNNSTVPADNATVTIDFGNNYMPSIYMTTTDNLGKYSFANLPATNASQTVRVLPHNDGTYDYNSATLNATLRYGPALANHNITVEENEGVVYVTNSNIETGHANTTSFAVDGNITVSFTHPMDPASVQIEFKEGSTVMPATTSWTDAYSLVINPDADLKNGTAHTVKVTGYATDGASLTWGPESLTTVSYDGIELLSTNIGVMVDGSGVPTHFPVSSNIELTYNKAPDMTIVGTYVYLIKDGVLVDADISVSGNVITINPAEDLDAGAAYILGSNVASVAGDYANDTLSLTTAPDGSDIFLSYTNLSSEFPVASAIKLVFSKTPSSSLTTATLVDEDNNDIVSSTVSVSGDTVVITPNGALKADHEYEYYYTVYANGSSDTDADGNCDTIDDCASVSSGFAISFKTVRSYTAVPAAVTTFAKDPTITSFADDLTSYSFEWTNVANATGYYIYAKDSYNNTDYVRVSGATAITPFDNLNGTAGAIDIGLSTQFDRYSDDADQTPLAGITLSFMITAVNYYGESTPSTAVTFSDNDKPLNGTPAQPATADNSGDAINAKTITVTVEFDEIMDVSTTPLFTIIEAGGDAAYVLPSTAITATWDDGGKGLTLTIVVPAGKNGAGDTISLAGSQFKDLTANVLQVGSTATFITRTLN